MLAEPSQSHLRGLFGRGLGAAQFAAGLGRVEKTFCGGHARRRREGTLGGLRGFVDGLVHARGGNGEAVGDPDLGATERAVISSRKANAYSW